MAAKRKDKEEIITTTPTYDSSRAILTPIREGTEEDLEIEEQDVRDMFGDIDKEDIGIFTQVYYECTNKKNNEDMDNVYIQYDPGFTECYGLRDEYDNYGQLVIELYVDELAAEKLGFYFPDTKELQKVIFIYADNLKTAVIKRDTDVLTKAEEQEYWKEVMAAMLEELIIWVQYHCFKIRLKKDVVNIMDSRNVLKWKWVSNDKGEKKRIIRCRVALRGFKDMDADYIETYAGTAARTSQRILTSEAANHKDWKFMTIDVNKAFFKELHMMS
jgi:hypothetical protein